MYVYTYLYRYIQCIVYNSVLQCAATHRLSIKLKFSKIFQK